MPTIRSRTRIVNLAVPSTQAVAAFLEQNGGFEPKIAARAARLAEGHIGIARLYSKNEQVMSDRDELIVATKAGYSMWPGPYGNGSSRKYLLASLDQSLQRMGLDYVDIFYSHRVDENTPMEETAAALAQAVQSGKALYVGISSYSPERTQQMAALLRDWKIPLLIHQPSYNLLNRWVDTSGLLDTLEENGVGCIAFTPLAQGLLTGKYLQQIPEGSRMFYEGKRARGLTENMLSESNLNSLRLLQEMAHRRGQSMAQMALSWLLKDERVTSVLIGASKTAQIDDAVGMLENRHFSAEELVRIDTILNSSK